MENFNNTENKFEELPEEAESTKASTEVTDDKNAAESEKTEKTKAGTLFNYEIWRRVLDFLRFFLFFGCRGKKRSKS